MLRNLVLACSLISVLACQKNPTADTSGSGSGNINLDLITKDQAWNEYQFTSTAGAYDVIITTTAVTTTSYPTYSSLDVSTIQGTLTSYNRLNLKPLHGIFVQGRNGQSGQVLANSITSLGSSQCSLMASNVDLTTETTITVEFDNLVGSDQVIAVSAILHQDNVNPCDSTSSGTGSGSGSGTTNGSATISFSRDISPDIISNCTRCHSAFNTYQGVRSTVWAKDLSKSGLYRALQGPMSQYAPAGLINKVSTWINEGALNN
jgi:hypothetical protein